MCHVDADLVSVKFNRDKFPLADALAWLDENEYNIGAVRYTQYDLIVDLQDPHKYKRLTDRPLTEDISLVIGVSRKMKHR